ASLAGARPLLWRRDRVAHWAAPTLNPRRRRRDRTRPAVVVDGTPRRFARSQPRRRTPSARRAARRRDHRAPLRNIHFTGTPCWFPGGSISVSNGPHHRPPPSAARTVVALVT